MEVRYVPTQKSFKGYTTEELRNNLLISNLFVHGKIEMLYSELDRAIVGSAVPTKKDLFLESSKKEMGTENFLERREIGIINIGNKGYVKVDKKIYDMNSKDGLYIGKGNHQIYFGSKDKKDPALFYFVSYPAHQVYPTEKIKFESAIANHLGTQKDCNERIIHKYIHPDGVKSCQLVMGLTELEEGCVWNTMPAHTHQRRSEVYMYFNLDENGFVVHMMGEPTETRHIIVRNREAVINPSWSIHSGAGVRNYTFIWAMGGENQVFDDMDWVAPKNLK
jgi:4-deoxy-L-threo-5-hexosulose-uronate ketol-isomerase